MIRSTVLTLLMAGGLAYAAPPGSYFPLDIGNKWTYVDVDRPEGDGQVVKVTEQREERIVVDFYGNEALIADRQTELDIDLPDIGLVSYYRFAEKTFIHNDIFSCENQREMTVGATDEIVETPAGVFEDCLRLDYGSGNCVDAGRGAEWWKADVGLVKWVEQSFIGPRTRVLKSFEHQDIPTETFRRGDSDGSGSIDLSDAVFTLNYLFTGGRTPGCSDAADTNDDGSVDIGDPIALLGFLFLGSAPPRAPGPTECGVDPSADSLLPCDFPACKQGFGT